MTAQATTEPEKRPLKDDLRDLVKSPRELWLILMTKFLEYVGIFSLLYVLTLWLSKDLGMNDIQAGYWAGLFSLLCSIFAFFIGFIADSIGFRIALISAFALSVVGRGAMSVARGPGLALTGLMVLAVGVAAGTPSMNAALRRYSNARTRSFAFSLYYLSFNIGGAVAGFLVDWARERFQDPVTKEQVFRTVHLPLFGDRSMSAYGVVFLVGTGCSFAALIVSLMLRKNVEVEPDVATVPGQAPAPVEESRVNKSPWGIASELMREKAFWRFMLFVALLSLVKLIFQHYNFTWPKWVLREMGESFPMGKMQSINPIIIIVLVPIATALTRHRSAFNCIILGSLISTVSMFVLCLPASYPVILASIIFLSIGEALWSPRLYEYTAAIAPKGREASYMGLSVMPYFLAKMIAGPMSGYLLTKYVPEHGPRHAWIMWLIIGLMTLAGPIAILALRSVIEGKREPKPLAKGETPSEAAA